MSWRAAATGRDGAGGGQNGDKLAQHTRTHMKTDCQTHTHTHMHTHMHMHTRKHMHAHTSQEKDSNNRPDEELAAEAWAGYKLRNNSVIVDHFQVCVLCV